MLLKYHLHNIQLDKHSHTFLKVNIYLLSCFYILYSFMQIYHHNIRKMNDIICKIFKLNFYKNLVNNHHGNSYPAIWIIHQDTFSMYVLKGLDPIHLKLNYLYRNQHTYYSQYLLKELHRDRLTHKFHNLVLSIFYH
jgi:hypothetical protein